MLMNVSRPSVSHIRQVTCFKSALEAQAALAVLDFLKEETTQLDVLPGKYNLRMNTFHNIALIETEVIPKDRTFWEKLFGLNKPTVIKCYTYECCAFGLIHSYMEHRSPGCSDVVRDEEANKLYHSIHLKREEVYRALFGYLHTGVVDLKAAVD